MFKQNSRDKTFFFGVNTEVCFFFVRLEFDCCGRNTLFVTMRWVVVLVPEAEPRVCNELV